MSYKPPEAKDQIDFLIKIQRLLNEGGGKFTATYKFALLLSIADLAVEIGDDSGKPLKLAISTIAEKFIEYYWGHFPFPGPEGVVHYEWRRRYPCPVEENRQGAAPRKSRPDCSGPPTRPGRRVLGAMCPAG